jgi:hypothetical protein
MRVNGQSPSLFRPAEPKREANHLGRNPPKARPHTTPTRRPWLDKALKAAIWWRELRRQKEREADRFGRALVIAGAVVFGLLALMVGAILLLG